MKRKVSASSVKFFGRQGFTSIAHTEYIGRWTSVCLHDTFRNTLILGNILNYFQNIILETKCENFKLQSFSFTQGKQRLVIKDSIKPHCYQIKKII